MPVNGLLLAASALLAAAAAGGPAAADPLSGLRWDRRILVVSAVDGPALDLQRRLFEPVAAGLDDRDMLAFALVGDRVVPLFGTPPALDAAAVRAKLGLAAGAAFRAVLVGKDGGVKWSSDEPVAPAVLFAVIDAMPMRRSETKGG